MRLFRCNQCGHKMRVSRSRCGRCYADKSRFQRSAPVYTAFAVIAVFAVLGGLNLA